jgi:hypothetical protein
VSWHQELQMRTILHCVLTGTLLTAGVLSAQDGLRGHWSGNIELPDRGLGVEVDIDKTAKGWVGSISIPAQNASGVPMEAITFADGKGPFRIKGVPGQPTFNGILSQDGKTLAGDFTQGPGTLKFKLSRTGEAKVEEAPKSPPVAKEFVGTWEGTLDTGTQLLRLVFRISNNEDGASGVLVSVDQGGAEIGVTSIEQKGASLVLTMKTLGGDYKGEINKEGTELTGTWTQAGNSARLKLTRKSAEPAKP